MVHTKRGSGCLVSKIGFCWKKDFCVILCTQWLQNWHYWQLPQTFYNFGCREASTYFILSRLPAVNFLQHSWEKLIRRESATRGCHNSGILGIFWHGRLLHAEQNKEAPFCARMHISFRLMCLLKLLYLLYMARTFPFNSVQPILLMMMTMMMIMKMVIITMMML